MKSQNYSKSFWNESEFESDFFNVVKTVTEARTKDKPWSRRAPNSMLIIAAKENSDRVLGGSITAVTVKPKLYWAEDLTWQIDKIKWAAQMLDFKWSIKGVVKERSGNVMQGWAHPNGKIRCNRTFEYDNIHTVYNHITKAFADFVLDPIGCLFRPAGNCCICGKALSDEISMSRGIGPECWGQVCHIATHAQDDAK